MGFSSAPTPGPTGAESILAGPTAAQIRLLIACLLAVVLLGSGCSQSIHRPSGKLRAVEDNLALSNAQLDLIATDLVTALLQVGSLSPFSTTLQVSAPPSAFGKAVLTALEYGGYGLQEVTSDQGTHYLSYASRTSLSENGLITDYMLQVGEISIRRAYDLRNNILLPVSAMYIKGASAADNIRLNDNIFPQQSGQLSLDNRLTLDTGPVAGVVTANPVVSGYANRAPQQYNQRSALLWAQNLSLNRHKDSKIPDLSRHRPVQHTEIEFLDHSMFLGLGNKRAIESLANAFRPEQDLFYLIACTADRSVLSNRSAHTQRVLEEFLLHGVPDSALFNKRCASGDQRATASKGGSVIILHYRKLPQEKK